MRNLMLISSSRTHGSGFLEHCLPDISAHLDGINRLLFLPYALADRDSYASLVAETMVPIGVTVEAIHTFDDPVAAVEESDAIFIGGGNSFRLLKTLYDLKLVEPIRKRVEQGMPYMGSSAGTNMACPTIRTTNDMPILEPPSLNALGLIPFQINPHYLDPDPDSTHKGETREQRIREFHEENEIPVAGIREGTHLLVTGDHCTLHGSKPMRLFRAGRPPVELEPGSDLDFLLS